MAAPYVPVVATPDDTRNFGPVEEGEHAAFRGRPYRSVGQFKDF